MRDLLLFGPSLVVMACGGVIFLANAAMAAGWGLGRRAAASPAPGPRANPGGGQEALALAPGRRGLAALALVGLGASLLWTAILVARGEEGPAFRGLLAADSFSYFFNGLFAGIAALVVLASTDYAERLGGRLGEYYGLVLVAAAGMMLMAASVDLIALFLALELTAVCLYVLAAFLKDAPSAEAGLKYLLLGAISSAVTLYGMALLFGLTGSTALAEIGRAVGGGSEGMRPALILALAFLGAGLAFKLATVPSQMWVPDVYEGSPTPVAAYLSVGSKAAGFALVMRLFFQALGDGSISSDWAYLFAGLAALSMSMGNLAALVQRNIKRLMGYSSIAQAGYLAVGLAAISAQGGLPVGASGVVFFLAAYALTNLAAFIVIIAASHRVGDQISDYAGLARRAPWLALALTLALVSLIGLPPTAGFVAKLYIFDAAVKADLLWLVIVGVINSAVSAYYYLYVVRQMYLAPPASEERLEVGPGLRLALAVASLGVLVVGVVPTPLISAAERAASVFA